MTIFPHRNLRLMLRDWPELWNLKPLLLSCFGNMDTWWWRALLLSQPLRSKREEQWCP